MDIWNDRFISPPPVITVLFEKKELIKLCKFTSKKLSTQDSSSTIYKPEHWVTNLNKLLRNAKEQLVDVSGFLELELKCMHSFIYQGGGVHKKEKYIGAIKRVARCLKRFKATKIRKLIEVNYDMIPKDFISIQRIRLPSPQSLYYLLHRLVGTFHLLLRSVSYCLESSYYFKAKLVRGFSVQTSVLGFAICGRIRALALDYCNIISKLTYHLNPYVMAMVETKNIQNVEDLPNNLQEILTKFIGNIDGIKDEEKINEKIKKTIDKATKVSEDKDFSFTSSQASKDVKEKKENSQENFTFTAACKDDDEDLGDVVTYSKFNELKNLSDGVLETSKSKKYREKSYKKGKKRFADEDNNNFKNKKQKVKSRHKNQK